MTATVPTRPVYHPQPAVPLARQFRQYSTLLRPGRTSRHAGKVSFVIFAQGRTGSTLLVDLLRSHPDVHCDEEILFRRVIAPIAWVQSQRRRYAESHYGFKVKPYQLTEDQQTDPATFLLRLHGRGWKVLHLWRRNVLRHALSNMVAEHVGRFVFRGEAPPAARGIIVDTEMLLGAIRTRTEQSVRERTALEGIPHASVCYEDDLLDERRHQATLDRLSDQLGLPAAPAQTVVRRITENDLRGAIANYDEVAAAIAGTQWAPLLHV